MEAWTADVEGEDPLFCAICERATGFTFRQAVIVKGRKPDTAWFSILDKEWPLIACALRRRLGDENFDTHGEQVFSLGDIRHQIVSGPAATSALRVLGSAVRGSAPGYVGDESASRGLAPAHLSSTTPTSQEVP
ncbi:MAG: hypothetical protein M3Y09_00205 [Actinomycetota bacterium]|nr:hypothetical protein [Actinomycetota bacterium]